MIHAASLHKTANIITHKNSVHFNTRHAEMAHRTHIDSRIQTSMLRHANIPFKEGLVGYNPSLIVHHKRGPLREGDGGATCNVNGHMFEEGGDEGSTMRRNGADRLPGAPIQ